MLEQRGMVIHIAEGFYEGTISWQKNPESDVSSHFVIGGRDDPDPLNGDIAQLVDTDVTAWTQRAGNGHWVSAECSGFTPHGLTSAQIESLAQLYARGMKVYEWPATIATNPSERGLGHHSMGCAYDWGHCDCPGPAIIAQKPQILARAVEISTGVDMDTNQNAKLDAIVNLYPSMRLDTGTDGTPDTNFPVPLTAFLSQMMAKLNSLSSPEPAPLDLEAIRAIVREELDATGFRHVQ